MKRKILLTVVVLGLLAAGSLIGVAAVSVVDSVAASALTAETVNYEIGWDLHIDDESLAAALGISVETLQSARLSAYGKAVDEALSLGLITESQAGSLKAEEDFSLRKIIRFVSKDDLEQIDFIALFADELGLSTEELNEALQAARQVQLDAAIEEGRLTQEQADLLSAREALSASSSFMDDVKSGYQAALKNAVSAGTITQEQADALWEKIEALDVSRFFMSFDREEHVPPMLENMRDPGRRGRGGFMELPFPIEETEPADGE